MHRFASILVPLVALCLVGSPAGATNEDLTIVLHAQSGENVCNDFTGPCGDNGPPVVDVRPFDDFTVFVALRNYDDISGLQAAFQVPASWTFVSGQWNCQPNALIADTPAPPWGPNDGRVVVGFPNCITLGSIALVGLMNFSSAGGGCMEIIEADGGGTQAGDCTPAAFPIPSDHWGRVCDGEAGTDVCEPPATPVESATWGAIKEQYR